MKVSAEHAARMEAARSQAAHAFRFIGPVSNLAACRGVCTCGQWEMAVPAVGGFGRTSNKARIAQVRMGHGMHVKAVRKAAGLNPATGC